MELTGLPVRLIPLIAFGTLLACSTSTVPAADGGPEVDGGASSDPDARTEGCELVGQTGCGDGEKCTVVSGDEGRLVGCAQEGDRLVGESCAPDAGDGDDCEVGAFCDASSTPAVCVQLCEREPSDTCNEGSVCALSFEVGGAAVRMCAPQCDPVSQDCSRSQFACYPSRSGTSCAFIGGGAPPIEEGAFCQYANECAEGLGCLKVGDTWSCMRLCDPFAIEDGCTATQVCNRVDDESWGVCISL